jgi:pimeloyl-ACP methyl ester carboxylesterase
MQHFSTVYSKDGTLIAFESRGFGPPLLMVHGSTVNRSRWGGIIDTLQRYFTLHLMDRRGRGDSGDAQDYAIEREFEDVAAVVEAIGQEVSVLGHSYGAICSLHAARVAKQIDKLVIYEPPMRVAGARLPFADDLQARLDASLTAGDRQAVLETFLREVVMVNEVDLANLKQSRSWAIRLSTAHTLPRELRAASALTFHPEEFQIVTIPTLVLKGNLSPAMMRAAARMTHKALPHSRLEILRGQGHAAMSSGPEEFLRKVLPFLLGPT